VDAGRAGNGARGTRLSKSQGFRALGLELKLQERRTSADAEELMNEERDDQGLDRRR